MHKNMLVVDAATHAYNLADHNLVVAGGRPSRYALAFRDALRAVHARLARPAARVPDAVFCSDWSTDSLAATLFAESDVDVAVHHRMRLDSLFADGLAGQRKNEELAARWPQRFLTYAAVNPLRGLHACLAELADQVCRVPGTVGLRIHPDAGTPDRPWRLDDPAWRPLFELAADLGLRVVAVQRVVPNALAPSGAHRVDDLSRVATAHPALNFEVLHAGLPPFVDEVAAVLRRLPNVYANLEITSALVERAPAAAVETLAQLVAAGVDRLLYSSGGMQVHPQPIIEAFAELTFPDALLQRYRIEQLSTADRAKILGGNYARMVGLDVGATRHAVATDCFAALRAAKGRQPAWSAWRAEHGLPPAAQREAVPA